MNQLGDFFHSDIYLLRLAIKFTAPPLTRIRQTKINNKSLINHVYEKGKSTNLGEVYVATGDKEIANEVSRNKVFFFLGKKVFSTAFKPEYTGFFDA